MGVIIMLGKRCITPGRRSRMASDIQAAFGHAHGGAYVFDENDTETLSALAKRGGLHPGEDKNRKDPEIGIAFRAIVKAIKTEGQAVVRLVY